VQRPKKTLVPPDCGQRVKALRTKLDMTQTRFAELLGVSFATVNRWENGQTKPSEMAWRQIVSVEKFGVKALTRPQTSGGTSVEESRVKYGGTDEAVLTVDFRGNAEHLWLVAEGERLTHGHLFNPAFATETSLIDPLPHQRIAVYDHMLTQPRLRFLLGDDAGAGKTIMSGLYIREMLSRRLIRRVLVVSPAGLLGNWERELRTLFGLSFMIITGADARRANPFIGPDSDHLIVSVDTLAGDRMFSRLQDPAIVPYDLVIFDECHKLSARQEQDLTVRKTARYRLAEALAGAGDSDKRWKLPWTCNHLVLLSATPHMGKEFPYYCLWRLLEPDVLSTQDAFSEYPEDQRRKHFIRRTKEEMVNLDGSPIYPVRISDTLSYDLRAGDVSEQQLYDEVTSYIRSYYNKAKLLNRSAARFAMSVFQRRLASSTYAILCSLKRREDKLQGLIDDVMAGRLDEQQLIRMQQSLDDFDYDAFDDQTADEEEPEDGLEGNEVVQNRALGGVLALNLAELEAERQQVHELVSLAQHVYDKGEESKFEKLKTVFDDPKHKDEKIIIFTEHRDTLSYLVSRLEGIGYAGHVATIHGGMSYKERDEQQEFFREPAEEGGAQFLVATDAAGEGINLQFCWIMVNFDIPWNPARLEQRMGRIHRYGQEHDPVRIINLIAGKTREGRVLKILLDKLEKIRKELGSDKVFDVIGRLFEGVSVREYMERSFDEQGAQSAARELDGYLTKEQVKALEEKERRLYGDGGDVKNALPAVRQVIESEELRHLLPGYVRRFVEKAASPLGLALEDGLDDTFSLRAAKTGAMDPFWPVLDSYSPGQRDQLTFAKPERDHADDRIWLHPGDVLFDTLRERVCTQFRTDAQRGAVFVDPWAGEPYMFHLAVVKIVRRGDPTFPSLAQEETLECRLVGLRQDPDGQVRECPVENLLLLKGGAGVPASSLMFAAKAPQYIELTETWLGREVAQPLVDARRDSMKADIASRSEFVRRGFDYQEAELAAQRVGLSQRARAGDRNAKRLLENVKLEQRHLASRRQDALAVLAREPELVDTGEIAFLAHALVVPSTDPEEKKRYDAEVEAIAMRVAIGYEEDLGADVRDVSKPELARAVGLDDWCGFDLRSKRSDGGQLAIEVKGRARTGEIELSENEWAKACTLADKYWLYVVYDCATANPRLVRIQNPFSKLIAKARGGVVINAGEVFAAAEEE